MELRNDASQGVTALSSVAEALRQEDDVTPLVPPLRGPGSGSDWFCFKHAGLCPWALLQNPCGAPWHRPSMLLPASLFVCGTLCLPPSAQYSACGLSVAAFAARVGPLVACAACSPLLCMSVGQEAFLCRRQHCPIFLLLSPSHYCPRGGLC